MDLTSVDPALLARLDRIISSVWWGGGALVVALCFRVAGASVAEFTRALRCK